MNKYIISIVLIISLIFGCVYIKQQRQFYYVTNDMCLTIWHDYLILGKYTSFFRPNNNYILIPASSVDICFEDSSNFVLYYRSKKQIRFFLQNYHITELYQGEETGRRLEFLNYKKNYYTNNPYCEIELCKERGRYVPHVDVFNDSVYVRTVYYYEDILQNRVDSSVYIRPLRNKIAGNQKEIELQTRVLKEIGFPQDTVGGHALVCTNSEGDL